MKKLLYGVFAFLLFSVAQAQQNGDSKDINSIFNEVTGLKAKSNKLNIYFNYQTSFDVVDDGSETTADFKTRQLRLEIKGNLTDKLFYRFRHRLNKGTAARSLDNMAKATDLMYVGYHFDTKNTITIGKQCQVWGGFQFDMNPMNIYEYSDMIENMDNFMLGVSYTYSPNKNNEFILQVTDVRNDKLKDVYGADKVSASNLEKANVPLTYILNWNGKLFDGLVQTRWAYGVQTEAKDKYSKMITLGTKLNLSNFDIAFDYMRSDDDIDRLFITSGMYNSYYKNNKIPENVTQNTYILTANYQPTDEWNIFTTGVYETTTMENDVNFTGDFREAYTYMGGVEYMPFKKQDLKIFLAYIGRKYNFGKEIQNQFKDYNTNRVSLGIMYRIKAF